MFSSALRFSIVITFLVALSAVQMSHAQTWTGLASPDNHWANAGNWDSGVPGAGGTAEFVDPGNGNTTISLGGTTQPIGTIAFTGSSTAAYTIGQAPGDALLFDAGGLLTAGLTPGTDVTTGQTFNAAVNTSGSLLVQNYVSSGTTTGNGLAGLTFNAINIGGSGTFFINAGNGSLATSTTALNGNITETAGQPGILSLMATTTGTGVNTNFIINGTNAYTGGTSISVQTGSNGSIQLGTDSPFGTGKVTNTLVTSGSSPQISALNGTRTIANAFDLAGGLTFVGTNNLVFTGPVNLVNGGRTLNVNASGITVTYGAAGSPSTITAGNPTSNGGDNVGKLLTLNAATGGTLVVNDVIQDPAPGGGTASGTLSLTGPGTIQLNALNTITGSVSITGAGTILPITVSSNALPGASFTAGPFGTGPININNGTNQHFRPTGGDRTISNAITLTTGIAMDNNPGESFNLTLAGPITMTNNRFISNGFSSAVGTSGGTLFVGSAAQPSVLTLPTTTSFSLSLGGLAGPIVVNDIIQDSNVSGFVNINPNASDLNPVTLNGANTYSGTTTIGGGTAGGGPVLIGVSSVGNPGSIVSGPFGKGTLVTNETNSTTTAAVPSLIPIGASRTIANAISMTSGFVAANQGSDTFNLTLTGPVTLTTAGRSIINNMAGILTVGSSGAPSTISLGTTGGQQLQFLTQNSDATTVVNDVIQNASGGGAGKVLVTSGTVQFNGASTYTNGTTVAGGKLLVNNTSGSGTGTGAVTVNNTGTLGGTGSISGPITNNGVLSPGVTVGTLTASGNFTDLDGSQWAIDLSGATADKLAVGGTLDLSGIDTLNVAGSGSGSSWVIASYTTLTGTFDSTPAGYTVDYGSGTNSQITLHSAVVGGVAGDYNGNGVVDMADYVLWRNGGPLQNEVSTPGTVDSSDYDAWRARFGNTSGSGSGHLAGGSAVPEPASALLVLAGVAGIAVARRSRQTVA